MMTKHPVRVVDLTQHMFVAPDGMSFLFRYSLEEFVPTSLVPIFEQYLQRITKHIVIPIGEFEPMYAAYEVDEVLPFFTDHIGGNFTLVTQHSDQNELPQDTELSGETPGGSVADALAKAEVSSVSGDEVPSDKV